MSCNNLVWHAMIIREAIWWWVDSVAVMPAQNPVATTMASARKPLPCGMAPLVATSRLGECVRCGFAGWPDYPVFPVSPLQVRSSRLSPLSPSRPAQDRDISYWNGCLTVSPSQLDYTPYSYPGTRVPILSPVSNDVPLIDSPSYTWL